MATRASLSINEPNARWIQSQIDSKEYSSRSEVVNDLIRKAREIETIRARLIASELSVEKYGWVEKTPEAMLDDFKKKHALMANYKLSPTFITPHKTRLL